MASTMDGNLGAMLQPQASTLNDLQSGSSGFFEGADQGMKTAIGLATASDQIEQKKAQTEQMKDQIEQMKFNKLTTGINNIIRADPKYRGAIADQIFKGFDRNGIALDPVWRDAILKDDSTRTQMQQALSKINSSDPNERAQATSVLGNYFDPSGVGDGHDKLQEFLTHQLTTGASERDAKLKADAEVQAAKYRAQATGAGTDIKTQNFEQRVHGRYVDKVLKNSQLDKLEANQQGLQSALVAYDSSGGMVQELHTLQQAIRNNSQGTAKSGVEERAASYASDLGIKRATVLQVLTGDVQNTDLTSPELVKAIKHIASKELEYQAQKADQVLNSLVKPGGTFYKAHPELNEDFMNTVNERRARFGLNPIGTKSSPVTSPTSIANSGGQFLTQQPAGQQAPVAPGQIAPQPKMPDAAAVINALKYYPADQVAQHMGITVDQVNKINKQGK